MVHRTQVPIVLGEIMDQLECGNINHFPRVPGIQRIFRHGEPRSRGLLKCIT